MQISIYLTFVLFAVSCNLMASEHLRFPEKDLEEIVVWGYYRPENPNRLDHFRQEAFLARDVFGSSYRSGCGDLCSEAFWAGATAENVAAEFSRAPGALSYRRHIVRLAVSSGGSAEAVKALLEAGAPPNARFEGEPWDGYGNRTVLQEASRRDADVVSVLLSFGALPHLADQKRRTPLHDAAEAGLTRAVTFLVKAGADPRAVDAAGVKPTDLAERLDNDAIRFLLRTLRAPPPCGRLCAPDFWKTVTAEQLADALAGAPYTRERSRRDDCAAARRRFGRC